MPYKAFFFSISLLCLMTAHALAENPADTVKKEIPLNRKGRPTLAYKLDRQKAAQLGLETLESGFDSLEIRIWLDYSMAWNKSLIILTRKNGGWKGRFITMRVEWNARGDSQLIVHPSSRNVIPKMGWEEFSQKLFKLGITTLPNGPDGGLDGAEYNMVQILHFLEREFNFKRTQL